MSGVALSGGIDNARAVAETHAMLANDGMPERSSPVPTYRQAGPGASSFAVLWLRCVRQRIRVFGITRCWLSWIGSGSG